MGFEQGIPLMTNPPMRLERDNLFKLDAMAEAIPLAAMTKLAEYRSRPA